MSIGLKTHIGLRPGIGYRGFNPSTFTMDMLVMKRYDPGLTFTCDMYVSQTGTSDFTCDMHVLTGIYTSAFTIDMQVIRANVFTVDMIVFKRTTDTFTADMHVATITDSAPFTVDMHVSGLATYVFTADMYVVKKNVLSAFTTDIHVATTKDTATFTMDTHVPVGLTSAFTVDMHAMIPGVTSAFTADLHVANWKTNNFTMDIITYKYPYYMLNGYNITNYVKQPDMSGLTKKLNKYTAPFQIANTIVDMGTDPLQYQFEIVFLDYNMYDQFLTSVNSDIRGTDTTPIIFYAGRDDFYHKVKAVSARPTFTFQGKEYKASVTLDLEDPYLYSVHSYSFIAGTVASGFTTPPFINEGSVNSPFEKVEITGKYIGGQHLTYSYIFVMDGATVETWIPISNQLLTDEIASLDIYGYITCTYDDDYATSTKYTADIYGSYEAVCSGGKVRISPLGYVTYKFSGPHPVLYNMLMTATLNKVGGAPLIYVSSDNLTWVTAVRDDQIANNVLTDYYINGSEKLGDTYVMFYCPSGATLDIMDIEFETIRDATYYLVPYIPAWATRTLMVYGEGSGVSGIDAVFRARKWP